MMATALHKRGLAAKFKSLDLNKRIDRLRDEKSQDSTVILLQAEMLRILESQRDQSASEYDGITRLLSKDLPDGTEQNPTGEPA